MRTSLIDAHLEDIFKDFSRLSVGFEPTFKLLDRVKNAVHTNGSGFPPYDLESIGEEKYRLSMAVAGFNASDIDVTLQDGVLTIEGKSAADEGKIFLHKGIAGRNFKRQFYLNSWIKVVGSTLENGILTIDFEQEMPDHMKPQKIAIGVSTAKTIEADNK